jgi:hypothetical protein
MYNKLQIYNKTEEQYGGVWALRCRRDTFKVLVSLTHCLLEHNLCEFNKSRALEVHTTNDDGTRTDLVLYAQAVRLAARARRPRKQQAHLAEQGRQAVSSAVSARVLGIVLSKVWVNHCALSHLAYTRALSSRRSAVCRAALAELAAAAPAAAAAAAHALHAVSALHVLPAAAAAADAGVATPAALPQLWADLAEAAGAAAAAAPGAGVSADVDLPAALPRLWAELADAAGAAAAPAPRDDGWLTPIAQSLDWLLLYFQAQLKAAHVPYASGWAIVCLTLVTKTLTFPFTKVQARPRGTRGVCRPFACNEDGSWTPQVLTRHL